jgi:hypothetical protein
MKAFFIVLLINCSIFGSAQTDFRDILGKDFEKADLFVRSNREYLEENITLFGGDPEILIPVIFPELVRFSALRDFFEIHALILLYTNLGNKYADFSIGPLQMKPSFVEKLEEYIRLQKMQSRSGYLSKIVTYPPECRTEKDIRLCRVERLQDFSWQLLYLSAFYLLELDRHPELINVGLEKQIPLYAVFYNNDLFLSLDEAQKRSSGRYYAFPGSNQLFSYSEIALYYYKNYYP